MKWRRLPSNEYLLQFADQIDLLHKEHKSSRPCVPDNNFLGLLGERKLAYLVGGDMDLRLLPSGDKHIDIWLDTRYGRRPVDVKVARSPVWLLVDQTYMDKIDRALKTLFVLGQLIWKDDNGNELPKTEWDAELLVWDTDKMLRASTPADKGGKGIISYWRDRGDCRSIHELLAKTNRQWGRGA